MKKSEDGSYELNDKDLGDLGMKPKKQMPSIRTILAKGDCGIGTNIPEFYLRKFQECAGPVTLEVQDVVMMFQKYLSLPEEHEENSNPVFKEIVAGYLDWKAKNIKA